MPLPRYFSLKHEFSNEWYAGFNTLTDPEIGGVQVGHPLELNIRRAQFPEYTRHKKITVYEAFVYFKKPEEAGKQYKVTYKGSTVTTVDDGSYTVEALPTGAGFVIDKEKTAAAMAFTLFANNGTTDIEVKGPELDDIFPAAELQAGSLITQPL